MYPWLSSARDVARAPIMTASCRRCVIVSTSIYACRPRALSPLKLHCLEYSSYDTHTKGRAHPIISSIKSPALPIMATYLYKKFLSPSRNESSPRPSPKTCAHRQGPETTPCLDCKAEKSKVRKYRWKIIFGLLWPYSLQALDATMYAYPLEILWPAYPDH